MNFPDSSLILQNFLPGRGNPVIPDGTLQGRIQKITSGGGCVLKAFFFIILSTFYVEGRHSKASFSKGRTSIHVATHDFPGMWVQRPCQPQPYPPMLYDNK